MIQDDYRAAIDVGDTKVVAMLARRKPDQRVELVGAGVAPCSGMKRGEVEDRNAIAQAVRSAVEEASAQAGKQIARAYVGLNASRIESLNRSHNVPREGNARAVTQQDINAALRTASRIKLSPGMKLLHVIPRGYSLDGLHGVRNPLGMHAVELHVNSHNIAGSIEHVEDVDQAVRAAGIIPAEFIVGPVATGDSVLAADEREEGVALIDVGGGTSDIAVFHEGSIAYTDALPVGGHQITNDLAIAFSIRYQDAEDIKTKHGTAAPELVGLSEEIPLHPTTMEQPILITRREIGQVIKERVQEIFNMVQIKLEDERLQDVPIENIVFTGGGAKVEGFTSLAKFVFQRKVRIATPRAIDGLSNEYRDPSCSAAAGIILWSMRNLPRENHVGKPAPAPAPAPVPDAPTAAQPAPTVEPQQIELPTQGGIRRRFSAITAWFGRRH